MSAKKHGHRHRHVHHLIHKHSLALAHFAAPLSLHIVSVGLKLKRMIARLSAVCQCLFTAFCKVCLPATKSISFRSKSIFILAIRQILVNGITSEPPLPPHMEPHKSGAGSAGVSRFRAPALPSGMVDVRFFVRQQDLGDRHDLIAIAEQVVEDIRQRLRRVLARVVEEHDGAVRHLPRHALGDLTGGDALPVERITIPYSSKPLPRKGLASIATFVQLSRVDLNSDITHVGKRKAKENKVNKRCRCAVSKTGTIRFVGRGISSLSDVYID